MPHQKRQTLSIQFLFILHGVMEIVVGTSDPDWQAHLKSAAVWTAAKMYARFLSWQRYYIIDAILTASLNI